MQLDCVMKTSNMVIYDLFCTCMDERFSLYLDRKTVNTVLNKNKDILRVPKLFQIRNKYPSPP